MLCLDILSAFSVRTCLHFNLCSKTIDNSQFETAVSDILLNWFFVSVSAVNSLSYLQVIIRDHCKLKLKKYAMRAL